MHCAEGNWETGVFVGYGWSVVAMGCGGCCDTYMRRIVNISHGSVYVQMRSDNVVGDSVWVCRGEHVVFSLFQPNDSSSPRVADVPRL